MNLKQKQKYIMCFVRVNLKELYLLKAFQEEPVILDVLMGVYCSISKVSSSKAYTTKY